MKSIQCLHSIDSTQRLKWCCYLKCTMQQYAKIVASHPVSIFIWFWESRNRIKFGKNWKKKNWSSSKQVGRAIKTIILFLAHMGVGKHAFSLERKSNANLVFYKMFDMNLNTVQWNRGYLHLLCSCVLQLF